MLLYLKHTSNLYFIQSHLKQIEDALVKSNYFKKLSVLVFTYSLVCFFNLDK